MWFSEGPRFAVEGGFHECAVEGYGWVAGGAEGIADMVKRPLPLEDEGLAVWGDAHSLVAVAA